MIMFLEDWDKYPSAIVDTKTTNKSFLRLAGLYKRMGVKNHAFLLSLINPNLQGVDPRDPNLDRETIEAIAIECKLNPWYFYREVFKLPPIGGSIPITFRANRANIASLWLLLNHQTAYLIQPRQTGKSVTGDAIECYVTDIAAENTEISVLTKDEKLRTRNSRRIKDTIETLPPYLCFLTKRDVKNNERITIYKHNNVINFFLGQKDKKGADSVGRGMTTPDVHIDEFGYITNIHITLPVILAASTAAREEAARQGSPYFTFFTTTPGKLNTTEGKFAYDVYKNSLRWNEKFFDLNNQDDLEEMVKKNTRKYKVILLEFNHRQLGYTDEWLKNRVLTAMSNGENTESDFFNKWVAGGANSPIPKHILEIINKSKISTFDPENFKYGYILKWYLNSNQRNLYKQPRGKAMIIGLDTSDALGGKNDDIGLVITDTDNGGVLASGKYNETNLDAFAHFLVEILERYPRAIFIPERKSSAVAILDIMFKLMLAKNMNPFKRIFNWIVSRPETVNNKVLQQTAYPNLDLLTKYKRHFGYTTSGSGETSRDLLYGNVFRGNYLFTGDKVRDPDLIDQLSSLALINGRIDHGSEGHDDLVIGWLLNYWFLKYGPHKEAYGLRNTEILTDTVNIELKYHYKQVNGNPKDEKINDNYIKRQEKLKKLIEQYIRELNYVTDEILALQIVNKIKALYKRLDANVIKNFNLESMLGEIRLYKKIKKITKV